MRLRRLHFLRFGCFTDACLDFADSEAGLHVIFGPNEAGKSTALRGLTGLLYGIPPRTQDAHRHDMKDLRIMAELEGPDGRSATFVRRKGTRDTLLDIDNKPIPDTTILGFLGGVGEEVFGTTFRFDHRILVRGGEDLLEGKGDVAESLFQAGTGISGLRAVLESLEGEAEKLFKPRSTTAAINHSIGAYEEARRRSRDLSTPARDWVEKSNALRSVELELSEIKGRLAELTVNKDRLKRIQLGLPHVTNRKQLQDELSVLKAIPSLPESATRERQDAQRRLRDASVRSEQAEANLAKRRDERSQLQLPVALLDQTQTIAELYGRLDSFRQAVRDLPKIRAEQVQFESDAHALLNAVRPGLPLAEAHALRLTPPQRARIRSLVDDFSALQERLRAATVLLETTTRSATAKRTLLKDAAQSVNTDELERVLERAQSQGDLDAALQDAAESLYKKEQQAVVGLNQLTLWSGSLAQLETMPVPSLETIDRFDLEWSDLNHDQDVLRVRSEENQADLQEADREIKALQLGGAVPMESELEQARQRRSNGWRLVRRAWLDGAADPSEHAAFDAARPLEVAYEQSVTEADAIVDRLRREADRVARLAGLVGTQEVHSQRSRQLAEQGTDLASRQTSIQKSWLETWRPCGITPLSPKEMRAWLGRHTALVAIASEKREAERLVEQLRNRVVEHVEDLSRILTAHGESTRHEAEKLRALVRRSQVYLDRQMAVARQRQSLEGEVARLDAERDKADEERRKVGDALTEWHAKWQDAIATLGLPQDSKVDGAIAAIESLDLLAAKLGDIANRRDRQDAMQSHVDQFASEVKSLVHSVASELHTLPPDHAVARLQDLLTAAQKMEERLQTIDGQIQDEQQTLDSATRELNRANSDLDSLMQRANCPDLMALEATESASARARELKKLIDDANKTLGGFCAGAPLETFLAEVAGVSADQIPFDIGELEHEMSTLDNRRTELEQAVGSRRNELKAIDGSDRAALAADEAQAALASVRADTERYLRLRMASAILRRHIEHFREQNQHPIIQRASEIFPRLTRNSFARLTTDFDDKDRPILLGVRSTDEVVGVAGMSDGTRDQLFLALRLASLERQLDSIEPFPIVVDDVLVNFDDDRAKATLEVLGEVSRRTQVLFFTHHTRLVELARTIIPTTMLKVHELDSTHPQ